MIGFRIADYVVLTNAGSGRFLRLADSQQSRTLQALEDRACGQQTYPDNPERKIIWVLKLDC